MCCDLHVLRLLAPLLLAYAVGCTETQYLVTVDDPAVVRVVPPPPNSSTVRGDDGSVGLHWTREVDGKREAEVTPIVDALGHVAPHIRGFASDEIEFPIGQVALPDHICVRPHGKGCREGYTFEIVAPLEHVRDVRQVTRYDPFFSAWLLLGGVVAGGGSAATLTTDGAREPKIAAGVGLAALSAGAFALGSYFLLAPPKTTTLYTPSW